MKTAIIMPIGLLLLALAILMLFLFFMCKGVEWVAQALGYACGSVVDSCDDAAKKLKEWGN